MLDLIEALGVDLDSFDGGHSARLHSWLFPGAQRQSLCSRLVEARLWPLVLVLGWNHCHRSHARYR